MSVRKTIIFTIMLLCVSLFFSSQPVTAQEYQVVVVANSIDYALATDFIEFLENNSINTVHVSADGFLKIIPGVIGYRTEKYVVILGGPDAPEGIGDLLVQQILRFVEYDSIRAPGTHKVFVNKKGGLLQFSPPNQVIWIIAGTDRYLTQKAELEAMASIYETVTGKSIEEAQVPPAPSQPAAYTPSYGNEFTIWAGQESSSFSYWGFERSGNYTTIRLQWQTVKEVSSAGNQTEYEPMPVMTYTFENLPARIKLGGIEYDIISFDTTKITVRMVM